MKTAEPEWQPEGNLAAIFGITPSRYTVLVWLLQHPDGGRLADIAVGVGLEPSPVHHQLKQLVAIGAVEVRKRQGQRARYTINRLVLTAELATFGRQTDLLVLDKTTTSDPTALYARIQETLHQLQELLDRVTRT